MDLAAGKKRVSRFRRRLARSDDVLLEAATRSGSDARASPHAFGVNANRRGRFTRGDLSQFSYARLSRRELFRTHVLKRWA